jgi:hypothetical protein
MGVSAQLQDGVNGLVLAPGKGTEGEALADEAYGRAVVGLVRDPQARARLGRNAAKIARERSSPVAVEQKIADAFQNALEHAAACGLRPAIPRPKPLQWLTTLQHFKQWAAGNGGVYVFGHLRPAKQKDTKRGKLHPQIAG